MGVELGTAATQDSSAFATAAQGLEADSAVQSIVAGTGVTVDAADPQNPVVNATGVGGGTVTSVSVAAANGFLASVATPTTTPDITIKTGVTGILYGNGTGVSAAVAGNFPTLNQNTTGNAATATATASLGAVATIAALRLYSGTAFGQTVFMQGYTTQNDGGQGPFQWGAYATDNGGTIITPTGQVAGSWYRIFSGPVNVRYFGAVGNGTTDDSAAINAALTVQDNVIIPDGTYYVNSAVILNDNNDLELSGGATILRGNSINATIGTVTNANLSPTGGNTNIRLHGGEITCNSSSSNGSHLILQYVTGLYLFNMQFTGDNPNPLGNWTTILQVKNAIIDSLYIKSGTLPGDDGLHISGGDHIAISNCWVESGDDCYTFVIDSSTTWNITDISISNCVGISYTANLFKLDTETDNTSNKIQRIVVSNLVGTLLSGNTGSGFILIDNNQDGQISDVVIDGIVLDCSIPNTNTILQIDSVSKVTINNFLIYQPYDIAISILNNCEYISLSNITVDSPRSTIVSGNLCSFVSSSDIYLDRFNLIGFSETSIYFSGITRGSLKNSIINGNSNSSYVAVSLQASTQYVEVSGNVFYNNLNGFLEGSGCDYNNIHDNSFMACTIPINGITGTHTLVNNNIGYSTAAATTPTIASGTVYQNTLATPITLYVPVTFTPLAGSAATCAIALGSSGTPGTISTETVPAGTALDSFIRTLYLSIPPSWYYKFTVTNATIGTTTQVTGV